MVPLSGPAASTADIGLTIVSGPLTEVPDWLAAHVIRRAEPEPGAPSSPVHIPVTSGVPGDVAVPESLPHADFGVTGLNPHDPSRAALQRNLTGGGASFLGTQDVVMEANVRRLAIPLAQLGGDDGRLQFKVDSYQVIASSGTTQTIAQGDLIPNFGVPAGIVR